MTIIIRPIEPQELPELFAVEQASHEFPWTEGILKDCLAVGYPSWAILEEDRLVGYGMMSLAVGECHILNVCVIPDARRKGYARQLMQTMLAAAKAAGAEVAFLEVRVSNQAALNLYRQLGFNEIGIRKNYYPDANGREDAVMLGYQF